MLKKLINRHLIILLTFFSICSCKKHGEDQPAPSNSRLVKYEITGNYTGKFTVIYNDNINGNTVLNNVSIPWSKEITYSSSVLAVGIGAQAAVTGSSGQTATLKIYSGGNVVQSSVKTAGSLGELVFQTLSHTF